RGKNTLHGNCGKRLYREFNFSKLGIDTSQRCDKLSHALFVGNRDRFHSLDNDSEVFLRELVEEGVNGSMSISVFIKLSRAGVTVTGGADFASCTGASVDG